MELFANHALKIIVRKSTNPPNFCSVCGRGKWFAALVQCCNCDSLIHVNAACSKLIVSKELQSKVKNLACDECSQSKPELLDLPIFEEKKELKKKESKPNKGNLNLNPPKKCKKKKRKKKKKQAKMKDYVISGAPMIKVDKAN
eukprot:464012_1